MRGLLRKSGLFKSAVAVGLAGSLVFASSGCMLSRLVDRGFTGAMNKPKYKRRIYTGLFLMPIAAAVDLASSPIQLMLLVILGDDFPFGPEQEDLVTRQRKVAQKVESSKGLKGLPDVHKAKVRDALVARAKQKKALPKAMGLTAKGEWIEVPINEAERRAMLARTQK
jgi:hypothetical protein